VILVGELCLWIALLMAAWSATVSFAGGALGRRDLAASGRRALYVAFAALLVATAGVIVALVQRDFSLAYVALHTNLALPAPYAVTALWSGPAGSMLLWALCLAGAAVVLAPAGAARDRTRGPWSAGVSATLLLFVLLVVCLQANPYERLAWHLGDGQGLDPRLQVPAMVLQRPLVLLGYAALMVPIALTLGGLLARRLDAGWAASARRWALAGWALLGAGVLLAAREAGAASPAGGWAWTAGDLVALGVWGAATALLHTLAIAPRRGLLVKWNSLLSATVALGALAGGYLMAAGAGAAAILEPGRAVSPLAWVGGGVVLAAAAAYLTAARTAASRVAPGAPAPPRRAGGRLAHAAAVLLAVALAGRAFASTHEVTLTTGQDARLADPFGHVWRFVSQGVSRYGTDDHDVHAVSLEVSRDGAARGLLAATRLQYRDAQGDSVFAPVAPPVVRRSPLLDTRAVLEGTSGDRAVVRVTFVPLAVWVWIAGALLVFGAVVALWPGLTPRDGAGTPA